MREPIDVRPIDDHEAKLERALVDEFLRQRGRSRGDLMGLPDDQRQALLAAARMYAAERLAEIGARAHYVNELHRDH